MRGAYLSGSANMIMIMMVLLIPSFFPPSVECSPDCSSLEPASPSPFGLERAEQKKEVQDGEWGEKRRGGLRKGLGA